MVLMACGLPPGGDASLQNGLELAVEVMAAVPPYGHRELLVLMAALSTVDPGRIEDSINRAKEAKIR
jgi:transcription initiation factor TFIIH subunit 2